MGRSLQLKTKGGLTPFSSENGRDGEIRTLDLLLPKQALYQAKLRPEIVRLTAGKERVTNVTSADVANKILRIVRALGGPADAKKPRGRRGFGGIARAYFVKGGGGGMLAMLLSPTRLATISTMR